MTDWDSFTTKVARLREEREHSVVTSKSAGLALPVPGIGQSPRGLTAQIPSMPPAPPAQGRMSFRKHNARQIGQRIKDLLGDFWTRMQTRYGGGQ